MIRLNNKSIIVMALVAGSACAMEKSLNEQLIEAAKKGNVVRIQELLKAHAELEYKDDAVSMTPLAWASSKSNADAVKTLVKAGADVNTKAYNGATPLHHIAFAAFPKLSPEAREIIQALFAAGADPTIKIIGGAYKNRTPYQMTQNAETSLFILNQLTTVTPEEVQHIIPGVMAIRKEVGRDPSKIIFSQLVQSIVNEKLQTAKLAAPMLREDKLREKIEQSIRQALKKKGAI